MKTLVERDRAHLWHPYTQMQTSPAPLPIVSGDGVYLYTEDGRRLLDGISSWWVNIHGHAHPRLNRALAEQAGRLEHVMFAGCTHQPAVDLAERLLAVLPAGLTRVFYSDNGSTAVEVAIKLAVQYWGNRGQPDRRRPPKERVVGITVDGASRAYPWSTLAAQGVIQDTVSGERLVVFYRPGAVSARADAEIARSRAVGATGVFSAIVDGRGLSFERVPERFRDRETGSTWNLLGHAVKGPLAGKRLRAIPHVDAFWFAWAAFNPATSVYAP